MRRRLQSQSAFGNNKQISHDLETHKVADLADRFGIMSSIFLLPGAAIKWEPGFEPVLGLELGFFGVLFPIL